MSLVSPTGTPLIESDKVVILTVVARVPAEIPPQSAELWLRANLMYSDALVDRLLSRTVQTGTIRPSTPPPGPPH